MSQHQTNSGLWVTGDPPIPPAANVATRPVRQQQSARQPRQHRQAQVYDPATGMTYRWPPKLPKAAWLVAGPAMIGILAMMAFALLLIGAVANNLFF